jgi:hypothetical protein
LVSNTKLLPKQMGKPGKNDGKNDNDSGYLV